MPVTNGTSTAPINAHPGGSPGTPSNYGKRLSGASMRTVRRNVRNAKRK